MEWPPVTMFRPAIRRSAPRWFLTAALVLFPACAPPYTESGSTTGDSAGADDSSGTDSIGDADASSSATTDASSGQSASQSGSSTASTTDTNGDDTTAGTGTTGEPSVCGNGVIDPGEECDDQDTDLFDECSPTCIRQRIILASSEQFTPFDLGGLKLADGICRQLAGAAGLLHSETFVAWLSDSTSSAAVPGAEHCSDWTSDSLFAWGPLRARQRGRWVLDI